MKILIWSIVGAVVIVGGYAAFIVIDFSKHFYNSTQSYLTGKKEREEKDEQV